MERKNLDWKNIGFTYWKTDWRYTASYKNGHWEEGYLTADSEICLNECAGIFQYCQEVFEGLKAYTAVNGDIVTFRPDQNGERMMRSAQGMEMPAFPKERFLEALDQVVRANASWVPPYGTGAALYIRPYMFASSPVIGIKPAEEYQFRMFCTPVGSYFKGKIRPLTICVSKYDRAAPRGTGHLKAGLNYAMSLHAYVEAHKNGFDENMFLDPATRSYVEETGGANFFFVTKDHEIATPKSSSILPSITRRSMIYVAEHYLGLKVTERRVSVSELENFEECGLCGTAAVICPVGKIVGEDKTITFPSGMEIPIISKEVN
jgi:branched-chain amino acid aminotransferase